MVCLVFYFTFCLNFLSYLLSGHKDIFIYKTCNAVFDLSPLNLDFIKQLYIGHECTDVTLRHTQLRKPRLWQQNLFLHKHRKQLLKQYKTVIWRSMHIFNTLNALLFDVYILYFSTKKQINLKVHVADINLSSQWRR